MSSRVTQQASPAGAPVAVRRVLLILLGLCGLAGTAGAQSMWRDRGDGDTFSWELYKPLFKDDGQPFPASVTFLGARKLLLSGKVALVVDLPVVHARVARLQPVSGVGSDTVLTYTYTLEVTRGTEIANPYLGVEFPGTGWAHELGIRVQHDSRNYERGLGDAAEIERAPAFYSNRTTVHYALSSRPAREPGAHGRYRFALLVPAWHGVTYLLTYRGMLESGLGRVRLGAGLAGIVSVDPRNYSSLSGRMSNQIEGVAEMAWGAWRPALHVRQWLDSDLREAVPFVIGLRLEWHPAARNPGGPL